jgi:Na+/melibiose symporter-like transporter
MYSDKCSLALMVLAFLCLLYTQSMNIVRQMIAVSIFFYASKYVLAKQYRRALMLILLAGVFHVTVFLTLPFLPLHEGKRWQKRTLFIIFIASVILLLTALYFPSAIAGIPLVNLLVRGAATLESGF